MAHELPRKLMTEERKPAADFQPSILFVCTGNTCRSVMAEAFARQRFGDTAVIGSVGIRPQRPEDASTAIETLRTHFSLDASHHIPRGLATVNLDAFEVVVAMDKGVAEKLKALTSKIVTVWQIDDPWGNPSEYLYWARRIQHNVINMKLPERRREV